MGKNKTKLVLALDNHTEKEVLKFVTTLGPDVDYCKIGLELFSLAGPKIIQKIKKEGVKVFFDGKFHDIPNTVEKAMYAIAKYEPDIVNVHIPGGSTMMAGARKGLHNAHKDFGVQEPKLFGVTLLTSIGQKTLTEELGFEHSVDDLVHRYTKLAVESKIDGIICSPVDVTKVRADFGNKIEIMTPGIRPLWAEYNDQKRVMSPAEAVAAGVDYIVIGRPITAAKDPVKALKMVRDEMNLK